MANNPNSYADVVVPGKSRRLPEPLINPDGISSAITRRNAYEDGEHFPQAGPKPKSRRITRPD